MRCLLVFDHSNDIIYMKYNRKFALHIKEFAKTQGFIPEDNDDLHIATNTIVQIFSPLVTSQRVMCCQFGNSYNSIQGDDNTNFVFEEFMGYLFISIARDDVKLMRKLLSICVVLVRYVCGPDILMLKSVPQTAHLVTELIDSWIVLQHTEQLLLIEAVEQLMINRDLSATTMETLKAAVEKLPQMIECTRIHMMVFVQNKFLGLYSSKSASTLSPADILFLVALGNTRTVRAIHAQLDATETDFYCPCAATPDHTPTDHLTVDVLLAGDEATPKCIPHTVHVLPLSDGVNLYVICQVGAPLLASGLYETFHHLNAIQIVQMQQDCATLKPALENLEIAVKKLQDGVKKAKNTLLDAEHKLFVKQWEFMRKKYMEFVKGNAAESLLRAESATSALLDSLKQLLRRSRVGACAQLSAMQLMQIADGVRAKLDTFGEFLKVKALRNFTLGSDSLTINKYLEEFPGLVHFLYVDRTNHRVTTPTLDLTQDETVRFTKQKIWHMVQFAWNHLADGHLSLIWKDGAFTYSYFLWFEDLNGGTLKTAVYPAHASKALSQPGIFCGDFYRKLKETCFPKMAPAKLRCYELFLVHLGLVTPAVVLEQTRRLAATICEIRGHPHNSIDLL